MEPSCRVFEGISRGGNKPSRRHLSCYQCLHPVRWYLVIVIGVWLAETAQTCSAETIARVREGQNVTLSCSNQTLLAPIHFTWSRQDGIPIPLHINQNDSIFFLRRVDRSFSSTYVCRYSANGTTFNRSTQLIVQYPAEVKSVLPPSPHNVTPGSVISLSCIIDAVPVASRIIWLKHGTYFKEGQNITIPSATCSDSGLYKCFPSNSLGTSINGSVNIAVKGLPGRIILHDVSSTSTSITLHWQLSTNGCLPVEYSIEWQTFIKNTNARKENKSVGSNMSVTLTGLASYESYLVCVWAVNNIGKGIENSSKQTTQIGVPSEPLFLESTSLICMIKVKWKKPANINGPDELSYQVLYAEENSTYWNRTSNTKLTEFSLSCPHLQEGTVYRIKVRANNSAGYGKDSNLTMGTALRRLSSGDKDEIHDGYIVLAVLGSIAVVTAIVILVIYLRRKQQCRMSLRGFFNLDQPANPPLPKIQSFKDKRDREAVPYERFWNHVTYRHADTNYKFSSEFESLQGIQEKNKKLTWIHSQRPENQPKNRFANVVAYDQTRVVLSMVDDIQGSHYINANYVDSYNAMNFYIATQGPLANTIADFWRMVWEQNSRVIVMITNIIEKGRHKCAQYWPTKKRKTQDSGPIRVTLLREEHFAFFTLREFEVKPIREGTHYSQFKHQPAGLTNGRTWDSTDEAVKPMLVRQFHFTGWPDHGVPDPGYEIPVLDFIFKSTGAQVDGAGPIIVHCSAGVGRSGAFIVIDSMIKRIHDNGDLDIFNFLAHIRQQRNHLVQEECQYIFVHDVLLEYMQCGFLLSLPKRALKDHLYKIRTHVHSSGSLLISAEFERLNNIKIQDYNFKDGTKTCNVKKARNPVIIPVDMCRVKLYPRPSEEGSDYINASYIDGFWRREAYIATQYPLESTICDFWRMIWQENCRSVVMLLSNEELNMSIYPRYLPVVHDTARFGVYEVTMETESARGDLMIRDLRMTSLNEPGEVRKIRHFHFLHWPENSHPWSGQSVLQLVSKVDEWEREVRSNSKPFDMIGPIVVHCSTGVGRTGIYCILHTLWHQVGKEEVVSVFPTARLHFHQRPKLLQSQAQYEFCYDTLVEYIDADCSLYLV